MKAVDLIDVGPRVAGVTVGMRVRDRATGKVGEVVEVGTPALRCPRFCLFVGDVAVEVAGGYRVCGPEAYFWTQFDLVAPEPAGGR